MPRTTLATLLIAALAATGCADSIDTSGDDDDAPLTGKVQIARGSDGTYSMKVDASSATDWTYADFTSPTEVTAADAWDLRFQRFHISTNGGVSGTGGVQIALVTDKAFADVTAAPTAGFIADAADDDDADDLPTFAFEQGDGWYNYDVATHVLTPKPIVWVVQTHAGAMIKLAIENYYDSAGSSGWFTFHWAPL